MMKIIKEDSSIPDSEIEFFQKAGEVHGFGKDTICYLSRHSRGMIAVRFEHNKDTSDV
jgi:hypothetical protein